MNQEEISIEVKRVIATQLKIEIGLIVDEATFEELGVDSLDAVETVMALEEAFGINIPDEDANAITSVQTAIDYIAKRHGCRIR